jgi:hypothetical protein
MYSDGPSHCSYKLALRVSLWQPLGFCNTILSDFLVRQQITVHIPYYIEQSPSWAANRFSASQEIPRVLGNRKVHYRIHKWPPFQFLKTYLNIILPSTPGSSKWPLSIRFPHQNPLNTSPLPHMCYMSRPSHSSRFDHPINIWLGLQIIKFLIMFFLHSPVTSSLLGPNSLLSALFSDAFSLRFSLYVIDQVSQPYKTLANCSR